jgi:hypothetical protein
MKCPYNSLLAVNIFLLGMPGLMPSTALGLRGKLLPLLGKRNTNC